MSDNIQAIVVDDEPLARRGLKLRLDEIDGVEVIGECGNGREAINAVAELSPDLLFLDIQMPGMSGFDVVAKIQQDHMPLIIFATAYDQYAIEAFDVHAVDYLLKPIEQERLEQSVARALGRQKIHGSEKEKQRLLDLIINITGRSEVSIAQLLKDHTDVRTFPDKIAIKDGFDTTLVQTADIDWVDAAGDYMCINAKGETHVMRVTMNELEAQLDPNKFQRVHRSTIVNLDRVTKVRSQTNGEFLLILVNGTTLKMSRSYKQKISYFQ